MNIMGEVCPGKKKDPKTIIKQIIKPSL